jgi:Helix-turn-helix domain
MRNPSACLAGIICYGVGPKDWNGGVGFRYDSMADMTAARELLTTREVADYLRIKERKVYDLVRERRIPCIIAICS